MSTRVITGDVRQFNAIPFIIMVASMIVGIGVEPISQFRASLEFPPYLPCASPRGKVSQIVVTIVIELQV